MIIGRDDTIVTAYAEPANGPGWANTPLWVIVRDAAGKLRQECIQPGEQTEDMLTLYAFSALLHGRMTRAVEAWRFDAACRADKLLAKRRKK